MGAPWGQGKAAGEGRCEGQLRRSRGNCDATMQQGGERLFRSSLRSFFPANLLTALASLHTHPRQSSSTMFIRKGMGS